MPRNTFIQARRGTFSEWSSENPVLGSGEPGFDITNNILKIGDGINEWLSLLPLSSSDLYVYAKNTTGQTLYKGQVVYINSAQGNNPTLSLAVASGEGTSSKTLGLLKQNLLDNEFGYVISEGILEGIDTDAATSDGDPMWLSPTSPGSIVYGLSNKPYAPNHMVFLGYVLRKQSNNGKVYVKVQNGYELEELHNVAISGVSNGQFLQYNSGSGLWVASSSGNFTSLSVNNTGVSISGHIHSTGDIIGFQSGVASIVNTSLSAGTGISFNYNSGTNTLTINSSASGVGGGISNVVEDTSPELGGNLYLNNNDILGTGDIIVNGSGNFTQGLFVNGTAVSITGHSHSTGDIIGFSSGVSSIVSTTLVAGTGISFNYDNITDELTINSSGIGSGGSSVFAYDSTSNFPATGTGNIIYISTDNSKIYQWTGSAYIELGPIGGAGTNFPSNITGDILVAGDDNYGSVAILLHGDSSFVDSSSYAHVATTYGNVAFTGSPKFGSASLSFDGNGDYLTFPSSAVFNLTGDFTLEAWLKFTADANSYAGAYGVAVASRYNGGSGGNTGWQWRINGQTYTSINLYTGQTDLNFNGSAISQNVWHHVAITRSGSTIKAFVDGQQYGDAVTNSDSFTPSSANVLSVGRLSYEATYIFDFIGQIDDLRITNGVARYTSNFSVPTLAFANNTPYTLSSVTFSVTGNS